MYGMMLNYSKSQSLRELLTSVRWSQHRHLGDVSQAVDVQLGLHAEGVLVERVETGDGVAVVLSDDLLVLPL